MYDDDNVNLPVHVAAADNTSYMYQVNIYMDMIPVKVKMSLIVSMSSNCKITFGSFHVKSSRPCNPT